MIRLFFIALLFTITAKCHSQKLGESYEEFLPKLKSNPNIEGVRTEYDDESNTKMIAFKDKSDDTIFTVCRFNKNDKCVVIDNTYNYNLINKYMQAINEIYAKEKEPDTWKDYKTGMKIYLIRDKDYFILRMYY